MVTFAALRLGGGFRRRTPFYSASLLCVVIFLGLSFNVREARADAVDIALAAFGVAGAAVGIPISPQEMQIIKPLVEDIVHGKPVTEALKDAVLGPLLQDQPPQVQSAANCLLSGKSFVDCGTAQLPSGLQPAVACATDPNPQQCIQDKIIAALPPDAQPVARCLVAGTDPATCAKQAVNQAVEQQIASVVGQLEQTAQNQGDKFLKQAPTAIQNIVNVVIGIENGDFQQVLENGGAAVTKYVVDTILTPLLPPGVMALAGPVIDTIIENRIDLVNGLVHDAKTGDVPAAIQIIVEANLAFQVEAQCSLLNELPSIFDSFKDATCGALANIIRAVGDVYYDATQYVISILKDPFRIFNVPSDAINEAGSILQGADEKLDGKDSDCGAFTQYYMSRYATCYVAGASKQITDPAAFVSFEGTLDNQCRRYYDQCYFSKKWSPVCSGMRSAFDQQVQQLTQALRTAATAYSGEMHHFIQGLGPQSCDQGSVEQAYQSFINQCGAALDKQLSLGAGNDSINGDNKDHPGLINANCTATQMSFASDYIGDQACRATVSQTDFNTAAAQICRQYKLQPYDPAVQAFKKEFFPYSQSANSPIQTGPPAAAGVLRGDPIPAFVTSPNSPAQLGDDRAAGTMRGMAIPPLEQPTNAPIGIGPPSGARALGNSGGGFDTSKNSNATPPTPVQGGAAAGAVATGCPPGAVVFNGSCNSGGAYQTYPGGVDVNKNGSSAKTSSGGAASCPPGAVLFNGSCNSGGAYQTYPGGTAVNKNGMNAPAAGAGAGTSANTGGAYQVYPGGTAVNKDGTNKAAGTGGANSSTNTGGAYQVYPGGAPANSTKGVSLNNGAVDPKTTNLNQSGNAAANAIRKKSGASTSTTTSKKNGSASLSSSRTTRLRSNGSSSARIFRGSHNSNNGVR